MKTQFFNRVALSEFGTESNCSRDKNSSYALAYHSIGAGGVSSDHKFHDIVGKFVIESDLEVLQDVSRQDVCIGRVQIILDMDTKKRTEIRFWYVKGKLHHLDSVPVNQ